jgi:anoctamin-10
MDSLI